MLNNPQSINQLFPNQIKQKDSIIHSIGDDVFFQLVDEHIDRLKRMLNFDISESIIVELAEVSLGTLINSNSLLSEDIFIKPHKANYKRYLLYSDPDHGFIVMAVVWAPGASTPIHDHGTWGVVGVLKGSLSITNYKWVKNLSHPNNKSIVECDSISAKEGQTTFVLPPDKDIHMVGNPNTTYSVSIHTYGKELKRYNVYDIENNKIEKIELSYDDLERKMNI
jgi:predicted metal-dependent enzyme (double-stranded beta helix superfamily)